MYDSGPSCNHKNNSKWNKNKVDIQHHMLTYQNLGPREVYHTQAEETEKM